MYWYANLEDEHIPNLYKVQRQKEPYSPIYSLEFLVYMRRIYAISCYKLITIKIRA
jgi:hypothetical protein